MPITPFLKGEKFDAETTRAMGAALEMACVALRTGDCADAMSSRLSPTRSLPLPRPVNAIPMHSNRY
jgi:hypothetical protein